MKYPGPPCERQHLFPSPTRQDAQHPVLASLGCWAERPPFATISGVFSKHDGMANSHRWLDHSCGVGSLLVGQPSFLVAN
jgi:hypothetical protein